MWFRTLRALAVPLATLAMIPWAASANPAQPLPVQAFQAGRSMDAPVANFASGSRSERSGAQRIGRARSSPAS